MLPMPKDEGQVQDCESSSSPSKERPPVRHVQETHVPLHGGGHEAHETPVVLPRPNRENNDVGGEERREPPSLIRAPLSPIRYPDLSVGTTLEEPRQSTSHAKTWFKKLKRHSITSCDQLSRDSKKEFRATKAKKLEFSSLTNVKQQPGESLKAYINRFNADASKARDVDDSGRLMALGAGITNGSHFWDSL
uniref:Retrotransposon gag domain-containing protein n=1 Tax=Cannabis sativa TaxID=3483 RepID=A0A803Q9P2_CANSA